MRATDSQSLYHIQYIIVNTLLHYLLETSVAGSGGERKVSAPAGLMNWLFPV